MDWLLKSDPDTYSFQDLVKEGRTRWDGVANPTAMKNLREMKKGDRLVVYHTGKERAAVGLARVGAATTDDQPLVEIVAGAALAKPISLDEIKANPLFADSPLVRIGRLSVAPLTPAQYEHLAGSAKKSAT